MRKRGSRDKARSSGSKEKGKKGEQGIIKVPTTRSIYCIKCI